MGCTGKAQQRVNASSRHICREDGAYSNPTCALCAPFVWHTFDSPFCLCRTRMVRTHTPNKRSGANPSILMKRTTQTQCVGVD